MPSNTAKIPAYDQRKPANIPLHTLTSSSSARHRYTHSESGASDTDEKRGRSRRQSLEYDDDDEHSDFSLWSDTGDLVDQLDHDDDHNPLRPQSIEQRKHSKRVRYADDTAKDKEARGQLVPKRKEDIRIPSPPRRRVGAAARILATIMAPHDGPSRIHGLHGKKLLYFTSVFVSLGKLPSLYPDGRPVVLIVPSYRRLRLWL